MILSQGASDLQLLGDDDRRLHLLRKTGDRYRAVTSRLNWPSYNGLTNGSRYSPLTQITKGNVDRVIPKWTFSLSNTSPLQVTPVVVDGVMYVTTANQCYALDAGTGRQIWHYQRPRTKDLVGNAAGGVNRGVGVAGGRVFMVTDHAHLIALNRFTGALIWETEMADWRQNYNATGAPLPVGNLVISGTAGGDEGVRGLIAAFDQSTGKEVWRFWTVPAPGEPGSETWQGKGINHPAASAWLTGTYDPELDTIYWPVGNPGPDLDGTDRPGDNLYSSSVVALDAKTGKLKWHFQFTPHDVWDYDATETPALVDVTWQGRPRKLLLHANRNGFFYVLDRTDGKFLLGTKYVKNLTWASGLTAGRTPDQGSRHGAHAGRPAELPVARRSVELVLHVLQSGHRAVLRADQRQVRHLHEDPDGVGGRQGLHGRIVRPGAGPSPQRVLRAIDIQTGKVAWELPQTGADMSWGGVLSTATASCSTATTAAPSPLPMPPPASRSGVSRRTRTGRRRRWRTSSTTSSTSRWPQVRQSSRSDCLTRAELKLRPTSSYIGRVDLDRHFDGRPDRGA